MKVTTYSTGIFPPASKKTFFFFIKFLNFLIKKNLKNFKFQKKKNLKIKKKKLKKKIKIIVWSLIIDNFETTQQFNTTLTLNKKIYEIVRTKKEKIMEIMEMKGMENSFCTYNDILTLSDYFSDVSFTILNLIYKASVDGFGASDFHRKCDKKEKVMVIIKANNFTFGKKKKKIIF